MSATSTITGVIASTWWRTAKSLTCNTPSTTPLFGLGKMQWSGRVPMCFTNWASYMRISRRLCGDLKNNHCYFNCPVVWNDPFPHYFLIDYWLWDWFFICLIPPTNLNVSAVATVRSKCVMNSTFYLPVIIECGKQLIYQRKVLSCSTNVHCTREELRKWICRGKFHRRWGSVWWELTLDCFSVKASDSDVQVSQLFASSFWFDCFVLLAPKELYTWYYPMTIQPFFEHTPVLDNNLNISAMMTSATSAHQ